MGIWLIVSMCVASLLTGGLLIFFYLDSRFEKSFYDQAINFHELEKKNRGLLYVLSELNKLAIKKSKGIRFSYLDFADDLFKNLVSPELIDLLQNGKLSDSPLAAPVDVPAPCGNNASLFGFPFGETIKETDGKEEQYASEYEIERKAEFFDRFICRANKALEADKSDLCDRLEIECSEYDKELLRLNTKLYPTTMTINKRLYSTDYDYDMELLRWKLNDILLSHGYIYTYTTRDPRYAVECDMCDNEIDALRESVDFAIDRLRTAVFAVRADFSVKGCAIHQANGCERRLRDEIEEDKIESKVEPKVESKIKSRLYRTCGIAKNDISEREGE